MTEASLLCRDLESTPSGTYGSVMRSFRVWRLMGNQLVVSGLLPPRCQGLRRRFEKAKDEKEAAA